MYISLLILMGLNLPKPGDVMSRRGGPSPEPRPWSRTTAESAGVIELSLFIFGIEGRENLSTTL